MIQKITLLELNKSIQDSIKLRFPESIWVIAEISEIKVNRNGHCYLELIEKDAVSDHIIAKSRATIWAFTYRMLKPYFESATGYSLSPGIKVLVQASVEFHELYGFSLNITDIDPNYTIGDLARKKLEILNQLENDGIINMNKKLPFPAVPQKIAIISSETAAGYQDFMNQLHNNTYGYVYYTKLFPSIMQGLQAEESIINALDKIYNYDDFFDIVVIIRGGGSQADLSCFDNYNISSNVAQFPIPVLTGIGHDKDESVVDIVAFQKLKTPTAVAEYIINKTLDFERNINEYVENLTDIVYEQIDTEKSNLHYFESLIVPLSKNIIDKQRANLKLYNEKVKGSIAKEIKSENLSLKNYKNKLQFLLKKHINKKEANCSNYINTLKKQTSFCIKSNNIKIQTLENKLELLNPDKILQRGYSITYLNNRKITRSNQVKKNDEIITKLFDGFIRSKVDN